MWATEKLIGALLMGGKYLQGLGSWEMLFSRPTVFVEPPLLKRGAVKSP